MSPCEVIKYGNISGQVKYAFASQYTVDKRNPDKSAVGINSAKTVNGKIFIVFFGNQKSGNEDPDKMSSECSHKRKQKPFDQPCIIVGLVDCDDQTGIYDH